MKANIRYKATTRVISYHSFHYCYTYLLTKTSILLYSIRHFKQIQDLHGFTNSENTSSSYLKKIFKARLYYCCVGRQSNINRLNKERSNQRKSRPKVEKATHRVESEQRIQSHKTRAAVLNTKVKQISKDALQKCPNEVKFKNPSMIKRGKFKGRCDDRHIRCMYHKNSIYDESMKQDNMEYHKQRDCYCSNLPIIISPLSKCYPASDCVRFVTDVKDNSLHSNADTLSSNENANTTKLFKSDAHILSRVHQKFTGNGLATAIANGELLDEQNHAGSLKPNIITSLNKPSLKPTVELKKDYQMLDCIPEGLS